LFFIGFSEPYTGAESGVNADMAIGFIGEAGGQMDAVGRTGKGTRAGVPDSVV
jgi:hypothetical protein